MLFRSSWKKGHRVDDSFDVFAVHGMAGIAGALFVMLFGDPLAPAGVSGVFFGGELSLLWREPLAIIVTLAYAFGVTWLIATILNKFMTLRITSEAEYEGIDRAEHAESAYHLNSNGIGMATRTNFGPEIPEETVPDAVQVGVDKQKIADTRKASK